MSEKMITRTFRLHPSRTHHASRVFLRPRAGARYHARHGLPELFAEPTSGRDQAFQIDAGRTSTALEKIEQILARNVARRVRRERTPTDTANARIEAAHAGFERCLRVRYRCVARV